jgi:hypothetical protein
MLESQGESERAMEWIVKAAGQGDPDIMYRVGRYCALYTIPYAVYS